MKYFFVYIMFVNIISFFTYGLDKFLSCNNMWRVREDVLLSFGLFGGVGGSFLGMFLFRHKIRKKKFYILNIIWSLLWCYIVILYLNR